MKRLIVIFAALCCALGASAGVPPEALEMYRHGLYGRALELFSAQPDDPLCRDYAVLCAVKMGFPESGELVRQADEARPGSILNSEIHREYALRLFDSGSFDKALEQFEKVKRSSLGDRQNLEIEYKTGHCLYDADCLAEAAEHFQKVAVEPSSEYFTTARYLLGCIHYRNRDFAAALEWFSKAKGDARFTELCEFYEVDCHFMMKDYDFVISSGEKLYPTLTDARAKHISRLISESWLVKGNAGNAKKYLLLEDLVSPSDETLFHAGSVLYASRDFAEAARYFSAMKCQTDSLAQVALYQLGDSYIHTGNKVAALEAFRKASSLAFDENLREDSFYNYAKLSFELNSDSRPFKNYLKRYGTSRKGDEVYGYMAVTALASRDYAAAVEAYDNIDELDPLQKQNYIKANFLRADQLRKACSYKEAAKYLRYASVYLGKKDRLGQLCRYYMAEYLYRSEDYSGAKDLYSELYNASALNGTPEGSQLAYNIGYCCFKLADYDGAARYFDRFTDSRCKTFRKDALVRRADCDFARKDYPSAVKSYQKALTEFPSVQDIYPYWRQGVAYGLCGDKAKKMEALKPALGAKPSAAWWPEAVYEYAQTLLEAGLWAEAKSAFSLLGANTKDNVWAARSLMGVSMVLRNEGSYDKAIEGFQKVVKMMPHDATDALLNLKAVYMETGRPDKYQQWLEANGLGAVLSQAEKEQMYFTAAENKFLSGSREEARKALEDYVRDFKDGAYMAESYYYLAECNRSLGDKQKACKCYELSLKASQDGSVAELAALGLASMKYSLELYEEAYAAYVDALAKARLKENREAATIGLMRCAFRTKRYDECIAASSEVLKTGPDAELTREARYAAAKSYLSTSRRSEAFSLLKELRLEPATPEGAEAEYLIIRSQFDWGNYDSVQTDVYNFAEKCGEQSYWLAKAFLVLGDSFVAQGNVEQARVTYQSVVDGYSPFGPEDDVPEEARKKLETL